MSDGGHDIYFYEYKKGDFQAPKSAVKTFLQKFASASSSSSSSNSNFNLVDREIESDKVPKL